MEVLTRELNFNFQVFPLPANPIPILRRLADWDFEILGIHEVYLFWKSSGAILGGNSSMSARGQLLYHMANHVT